MVWNNLKLIYDFSVIFLLTSRTEVLQGKETEAIHLIRSQWTIRMVLKIIFQGKRKKKTLLSCYKFIVNDGFLGLIALFTIPLFAQDILFSWQKTIYKRLDNAHSANFYIPA